MKLSPFISSLSLFTALVSTLIAIGLFIGNGALTSTVKIFLAIVISSVSIYFLIAPNRALNILSISKLTLHNTSLINIIAMLSLLIAVNFLSVKIPLRWDLTLDDRNTLSPETISILNGLEQEINVYGYYSSRSENIELETLLNAYEFYGRPYVQANISKPPPHFFLDNINLDKLFIVISYKDRYELLYSVNEQTISSSIDRLVNKINNHVYYLENHGEIDILSQNDDSYSKVLASLKDNYYSVSMLNLQSTASIPQDASTLIVASPKQPLTSEEISTISAYLNDGGSAIFLLEPKALVEDSSDWSLLEAYFSDNWGIKFVENVIIESENDDDNLIITGNPVNQPNDSLITLSGSQVLFPSAQALTISNQPVQVKLQPIIQTNPSAWAETDVFSIYSGSEVYSPDKDIKGPLNIVILGVNEVTNGRIAVIGDADFAIDANYPILGNGDLILQVIDWLNTDQSVNIPSKPVIETAFLKPGNFAMSIMILLIFSPPLMIMIVYLLAWNRQRKIR